MEVHRVAAGHVESGSLDKLACLVEIGRVEDLQLVGAAEILKGGVGHRHIGAVHKHHMAAVGKLSILRAEDHVAGEVGHMHRKICSRRHMVVHERPVERDRAAIDRRDHDRLFAGRVGLRARDHQPIADLPALRSVSQAEARFASPGRLGSHHKRGLLCSVDHRATMEDRSVAQLPGVDREIDRPGISDHHLRGDARLNRSRRCANLNNAAWGRHQRAHPQLRVDAGIEPQRSVNPQRGQLGSRDAIDGDNNPLWHVGMAAIGGHDPILPGRWLRPRP